MLAEAILENIEILGFVEVEREDLNNRVSFVNKCSNSVFVILFCNWDLVLDMKHYEWVISSNNYLALSKRIVAFLGAIYIPWFCNIIGTIYSRIRLYDPSILYSFLLGRRENPDFSFFLIVCYISERPKSRNESEWWCGWYSMHCVMLMPYFLFQSQRPCSRKEMSSFAVFR